MDPETTEEVTEAPPQPPQETSEVPPFPPSQEDPSSTSAPLDTSLDDSTGDRSQTNEETGLPVAGKKKKYLL